MRDQKLILSLLREMSQDGAGRLTVPMSDDMEAQRRHHHMELLVDVDQAEWTNDGHQMARITSAGYDFLERLDKRDEQFGGPSSG